MRYFFLIIAVFLPLISEAQLTAPGMSALRYTSYPSAPAAKDPVFIYCNASGSQKGTIDAVSPKGAGPFDYAWYKWSDNTKSFSVLLKTETGVLTSSSDNLDEGGYKVTISGGFDTSMVGWIFIDQPFSLAQLQNRTCAYVALKGKAAVDTFFYNNIADGSPVKLPNGVRFLWSSDPTSSIPFPDLEINPQTFNPPLVDVTYKLQVSDSFGCISGSTFFYQSIHVKADFSVDPVKGGAPLDVTFTDKSVRGTYKYTWEFGDKTPDGKKTPDWIINKDSLYLMSTPFLHTYYKPGEYSLKLTIESDLHCIDSLRFNYISVDKSKLDIPNVFTPDGDGINDRFIVEATSLRSITVEVFSRSGRRVYAFNGEGEKLKEWQGWDGNINNTSTKASPGVYFYIIHAYGWDDIDYNGKEQRGFLYLYR